MNKYVKIDKEAKNNRWKVSITIPSGLTDSERIGNISLITKYLNNPVVQNNIQIAYIQRGPIGSSSSSNGLLYPAGNWMAAVDYGALKNDYSTPYVYHNGYYYAIKTNETCINKDPMYNSSYWTKIDNYTSIYTNFLVAENAALGSDKGLVMYDNFMYSQLGINKYNKQYHYSAYVDEIFDKSTSNTPSYLTGEFKPSTYIDYYSGTVACNKLNEQYDYFPLIEHKSYYNNGDKVTFINTHFMDLNKSHNLCILPRYLNVNTSDDEKYYIMRPGVVVLPKYDKTNIEDGIHVCISYPLDYPSDGKILKMWNTSLPGATISDGKKSSSYINGPTTEGYILVCADADIFKDEMYRYVKKYSSWDNYCFTYDKSDYEDCFIWNGWKTKFIMLSPGSELKLRSNILYEINCSPFGMYFNSIMDSDVNGNVIQTIQDENGNVKAGIRKRIISRQWIIENASDFHPIPLHVQIDGIDRKAGVNKSKEIYGDDFPGYYVGQNNYRFKCAMQGYLTPNMDDYTRNYKINTTCIALGSGNVNSYFTKFNSDMGSVLYRNPYTNAPDEDVELEQYKIFYIKSEEQPQIPNVDYSSSFDELISDITNSSWIQEGDSDFDCNDVSNLNSNYWYIKVAEFNYINKTGSIRHIYGPYYMGSKKSKEHSIFFNETMGTVTTNTWIFYRNPMVVNLNIDESARTSMDKLSAEVYNSTIISNWGEYILKFNEKNKQYWRYLSYKHGIDYIDSNPTGPTNSSEE